jgi:transcriptional regulator GlxA family with amidase domain
MVVYRNVQVLDVTGPLEVFARTSRWLIDHGRRSDPAYTVELVGARRGPVVCSSGLELLVRRSFAEVRSGIDTLLVAGGIGFLDELREPSVVSWIRRMAPRVRRLGSVCTGAFLLAEAGLLDGCRATTHWRRCGQLAERYPQITVDPDPIFVRAGRVYTSAGVTAGMDLALALVEEDEGHEVALAAARELVMYVKRPGVQSQFSVPLMTQATDHRPLRELQAWISEHPADDLSVVALARRAAMSPRNFARVFARELGMTPAKFVERARIDAARRTLENGNLSVEEAAARSGFHSAEQMRRTFLRHLRVLPVDYRRRFQLIGGRDSPQRHGGSRDPRRPLRPSASSASLR